MRYRRQVNYHSIGLEGKEYRSDIEVAGVVDSWIRDFERIYGKGVAYTKAGIELVSMDIDAIGKMTRPVLRSYPSKERMPLKL